MTDPSHATLFAHLRSDVLDILRQTDMVDERGPVANTILVAAAMAVQQAVHEELQALADDHVAENNATVIWSALSRRAREVIGDDVDQAARPEFSDEH